MIQRSRTPKVTKFLRKTILISEQYFVCMSTALQIFFLCFFSSLFPSLTSITIHLPLSTTLSPLRCPTPTPIAALFVSLRRTSGISVAQPRSFKPDAFRVDLARFSRGRPATLGALSITCMFVLPFDASLTQLRLLRVQPPFKNDSRNFPI